MKRLIIPVILVMILVGLSGIADSRPLIADTSIPDNETASSVNQTDSPLSANATITITMRTPPLPDG